MSGPEPRLRLAPLWWAGAWILLLAVVVLSLRPPAGLPTLWFKDKVLHFGAYFGMAIWFAGILQKRRYPAIAVGLMLLGAAVEIAQGTMGLGRSADWRDMLANAAGLATGLGLAYAGLGSWMLHIERRLGLS